MARPRRWIVILPLCLGLLGCKRQTSIGPEALACASDCLAGQPPECQVGPQSPVNQCVKEAETMLLAKDLAGFNLKSRECDAMSKAREGAEPRCTASYEACVGNCKR